MRIFISNLLIVLGIFTFSACGHTDTVDEKPAFEMTSGEIVNEFVDDEVASNQQFNDQVIAITGPVFELNKENGKVIGVKLSSDEFSIVSCTFQDPLEPDAIGEGRITVKGVCSGFQGDKDSMLPGGVVELKRAALVK